MLARQLIDAAFQRFAQTKVIAAQRQHRFRQHRAEQPVRQRDLHLHHAPGPRVPRDLPALDQPKARGHLQTTGDDIGGDPGARQPLERLTQPRIAIPRCLAVGRHQQIMCGQMQRPADGTPGILRRHQLADAIDQDILVKQRGQPLD